MKTVNSLNRFFASLILLASPAAALAYPQIDQAVPTDGLPISVYRDSSNPNLYWYIPQSIEPWKRDDRYRSSLYETNSVLSFVFRGQASVSEDTLQRVARAIGVPVGSFAPIPYEYSKNVLCENIFAGDPAVTWLFPNRIGNYLEVVPVSLRVTNADLVQEVGHHLKDGGLACTVEVGFKAAAVAYDVQITANLNSVYERFEANAHAGGLWWEVDIHTLLQRLVADHVINIKVLQDGTLPQTEIDKQLLASMEGIEKHIISAIFTPVLQLPTGDMAGRGKPWSLRLDYRRSEEHRSYSARISSSSLVVKDSLIGIRLAVE